jgi:lipopolysaccharide transport system ATP-binding protein
MSSDAIAIRIQDVGKCYHIYDRPQDRLKQSIFARLQILAGQTPRRYSREFWALRGVSLDVRKGETIGIIGRNGSGKSTLLQVICGTLTPTSGTVETNGRVAALLELGAGFNPEFTGRENVYMNGTLLGLSTKEIDARFDDICAFADIGEFIDQPVKTYSSGMYVRLAFAVIAHVNADILVIDEALAVGDAFFVQKCMRFLRQFMEKGTVLFVSHDTGAITNLCARAVWLERGQVRVSGSPKQVTEVYLAALYEGQQGRSVVHDAGDSAKQIVRTVPNDQLKDQRLGLINASKYRNDIEVFAFNSSAPSFGKGSSRIIDVKLMSEGGAVLGWVVGGEMVSVVIRVKAIEDIFAPIVGFMLKDRLGQTLFSDNTFLSYAKKPVRVGAGEVFEARFTFQMPILPAGDYVIAAAVAEGTQSEHVQHHWIHDALSLKSHSSSVCTGLVGIPMMDIELQKVALADGTAKFG